MYAHAYIYIQIYTKIYAYIYMYLCVNQTKVKNLDLFFLLLRFWLWKVSATFNPFCVRVSNFHIQWRSLASRLVSNWRMSLVYLKPSFSRIYNIWNIYILTLNQQTHTHFFHTTVSTQDILNNLLSTVNLYVTSALVLMTKFFSTMPPSFLTTSYIDNAPSLTSFITSTELNRSTDTNYSPNCSPTPPNCNANIFV